MPSMLDQTGRMGATTPPSTFGTPVDVEQGFTQDFSAPGTLADPLEKNDFVTQADVNNPTGLLAKLGISPDFDIKKALIETGVNLIAGVPISLIAKALEAIMPDRDPRQNALDELYDVKNGTIQSGLMKGYNPVSGGGLYTLSGGTKGEPPTYGLQEAYDDRIGDVTRTLQDKYDFTKEEIDQIKTGKHIDPKTGKMYDYFTNKGYSDTMGKTTNNIQKLADLVSGKAKEKARLDLFSGDIQESGDASIAEQIAEADKLGISGDIGVEGEDTDRFGGGADMSFDADTFDDDTATDGGDFPFVDYSKVNYLDPSNFSTIKPGGTVLEDDFESLVDTPTGLDLAKGSISMDDQGNYYNAAGELITKTEALNLDPSLTDEIMTADYKIGIADKTTKAGLDSGFDPFTGNELTDDQKKEIQKGNYQKVIDELTGVKPKKTSLNTIDTSDDKPQGPGPSGFVGLDEDMDVDPFEFNDMSYEPPADTGGGGGQGGGADMGTAPKGGTYDAEAEDDQYEAPAPTPTPDFYQDPITTGGRGGGGPDGCFLAGTLVTMADGSTKEIQKIDLGDNVAEGGKVFATGKFLVENLHDYKGIKVSGSHMVNEDNIWVRVEDSKHGKPLGDDEHTVYVFGSENRRILINGTLFTDYFEVKDQEQLLKKENKFFDDWKTFANNEDQKNVDTLNAV